MVKIDAQGSASSQERKNDALGAVTAGNRFNTNLIFSVMLWSLVRLPGKDNFGLIIRKRTYDMRK